MIEQSLLQRLTESIREGADLRLAAVFGSALQPRFHSKSDVDIAVQARVPLSLSHELNMSVKFSLLAHREVDLINLDCASTVLKNEIARNGRLLYEFEPGAWAAWQARAALEYWDFEPVYLLGQQAIARQFRA
ncbi:MAG: nucleotidyltransferase domain-containing protein [Leptospirales bacterium]|nr:nucleotidyltransferase domain-containing protein [Leptospirales bacterium]